MEPAPPALPDYLQAAFGRDGHCARALPGYEPRASQMALALAVHRALTHRQHLLAEGPCGTGKTLAYLVPAIHHALREGRTVVVATANIALQEQLVHTDLPTLRRALPEPFAFALLKGKGNYLCRARFHESDSGRLFPDASIAPTPTAHAFTAWAMSTTTGDRSELDATPPPGLWSRVCGDEDECEGARCRRTACFAWQAREAAREAQVVVCNYHVLFAHLQLRAATGEELLLPPFVDLICDEGHAMAEIARDFFGVTMSERALRRLVAPLRQMRARHLATQLATAIDTTIDAVRRYRASDAYGTRLTQTHWADVDALQAALESQTAYWEERRSRSENETQTRRAQVQCRRGARLREHLTSAIAATDAGSVYWIDVDDPQNVTLRSRPIDVAPYLREHLFGGAGSVTVTSATLTTGGTFDFLKGQVGCEGAVEHVAPSPFDYAAQSLLIVPELTHTPESPGFPDAVAAALHTTCLAAGGRTLGLFTSYRNLHVAAQRLRTSHLRVLVQGEAPRHKLLEAFSRDVGSVLLGVASFWTGVDVPGEACSCVFIDKLPFPTPADPVMDALKERDAHAFAHHFLPRAILTLRQGVGRLLRSRTDRGVIVLCDRRVYERGYGTLVRASLPPCTHSRHLADLGPFLAAAPSSAPIATTTPTPTPPP